MAETEIIFVRAKLPYLLVLPAGKYQTGDPEVTISLADVLTPSLTGGAGSWSSSIEMACGVPTSLDETAAEKVRLRRSNELLHLVNRLLRWYRVTSGVPQVIELTRAQLSPIEFLESAAGAPWRGLPAMVFTSTPPPVQFPNAAVVTAAVRAGFGSGIDPDVASLNLRDAQYASTIGRFREAVLFCWAAIDATFSRKYSSLVSTALAGELASSIDYLSEFEIPLKVRMSAMMHLVANRSLYREAGLWEDLVKSYDKRNRIIHRGETASEDDATRAITVAEKVTQLMQSL